MINAIVMMLIRIKQEIKLRPWGCKFMGNGDPRNPLTLSPHEHCPPTNIVPPRTMIILQYLADLLETL
jgi:hypothetical protein